MLERISLTGEVFAPLSSLPSYITGTRFTRDLLGIT